MPDDKPTIVVFRRWKPTRKDPCDEVFALFPEDNWGAWGHQGCTSYAHVGQHSSANYDGCIARSRPATPKEYAPLLKELKRIGYDNLVIRKRRRYA